MGNTAKGSIKRAFPSCRTMVFDKESGTLSIVGYGPSKNESSPNGLHHASLKSTRQTLSLTSWANYVPGVTMRYEVLIAFNFH